MIQFDINQLFAYIELISRLVGWLVEGMGFYVISIFVGYPFPNSPVEYTDCFSAEE